MLSKQKLIEYSLDEKTQRMTNGILEAPVDSVRKLFETAYVLIPTDWIMFGLEHDNFDNNPAYNRIYETLIFAADKHKNYCRKSKYSTPIHYIINPIEVAWFLWVYGIKDISLIQAALLHDTLEDTPITEDEIYRTFGQLVLNIVVECTDAPGKSYREQKQYQIDHAIGYSISTRLLKLADFISNTYDLFENKPTRWTEERQRWYGHWALAVWRKISGLNEYLDAIQRNIFVKHGYDIDISDEDMLIQLDGYYNQLDIEEAAKKVLVSASS